MKRIATSSQKKNIITAGATWPSNTRLSGTQALSSLPRLLEISQIGRRLVLAGGQEGAAVAFEIKLVTDLDQDGDPWTIFLAPLRVLGRVAPVGLEHGPRP